MWSVLAKSGLLSERERMPTRSLIYILLPQGYQPQALRVRFGDEAVAEFEAQVNGLENMEQLRGLHRLAIESRRLSQFRKGFPKP